MLINRIINFAAIFVVICLCLSVSSFTILIQGKNISNISSKDLMSNQTSSSSFINSVESNWLTSLVSDPQQKNVRPPSPSSSSTVVGADEAMLLPKNPSANAIANENNHHQNQNNLQSRTTINKQHIVDMIVGNVMVDNNDNPKIPVIEDDDLVQSQIFEPSTTITSQQQQQQQKSINNRIKRNARDISKKENTRDNVHSELDMQRQTIELYNVCSKGTIAIKDPNNNDVNAHFRSKPKEYTQATFLSSEYGGFAIFFYHQNKFLCIDPNSTDIVFKDCFDWCLCSFNEESISDFFIFSLVSRPDWKLSFNHRGMPISMSSAQYRRRKFLKCRNFMKRFPQNYYSIEEQKAQQQLLSKFNLNELTCDWKKTGERIFDKEIKAHPKYDCILSNYPQMYQDINHNNNNHYKEQSLTTETKSTRCMPKREILNGSKRIRHLHKKARHLC